jgi:hypothetical protein
MTTYCIKVYQTDSLRTHSYDLFASYLNGNNVLHKSFQDMLTRVFSMSQHSLIWISVNVFQSVISVYSLDYKSRTFSPDGLPCVSFESDTASDVEKFITDQINVILTHSS